MKKIITTLLSVSLLAGIGAAAAGCGDGNGGKDGKTKPSYVPKKEECKNLDESACKAACATTKSKQQCLGKIEVEGRKAALESVKQDQDLDTLKKEAVKNYSDVAYAAYTDTYNSAVKLKQKVDAFVEYATTGFKPDLELSKTKGVEKYAQVLNNLDTKLEELKVFWKKARPTYLQTEAYRFYDGPINSGNPDPSYSETGQKAELEPIINPWPMAETYLDYGCANGKRGFSEACDPHELADDHKTLTKEAVECQKKREQDQFGTFGDKTGTEEEGQKVKSTAGYSPFKPYLYGACDPKIDNRVAPTDDNAIDGNAYKNSIIGSNAPLSESYLRDRNYDENTKDAGGGHPSSEEDIATGWHSIEFLLWGQDFNFDGPGHRPVTDFLIPVAGHEAYTGDDESNLGEKNAKRRLEALQMVTDMMIKDLKYIMEQWAPGKENYRKTFEEKYDESFGKILKSQYELGIGETGGERLVPAYEQQNQEQEHSCFSDNTDKDFIYDLQGMLNVWNGTYYEWDWDNEKLSTKKTGDESKSIKKAVEKYEELEKKFDTDNQTEYFKIDSNNPPSKVYETALTKFHTDAVNLLDPSSKGGESFDRVLLKKYVDPVTHKQVDNTATNNARLKTMVEDSQVGLDKAFPPLFEALGLDIPSDDE